MELEIVSKEIVKPLSPTPPELRIVPLSLLDQHAPNVYIQLLYFYNNTTNLDATFLKYTLSKALTFYYPFAGRLRDRSNSIDCNDMGAAFLEAKLPCPISQIMNNFHSECDESSTKLLWFDDMNGKDPRFDPLLSVQFTRFECGGEVMNVFLSHKVADLATFTNFMNDWATIARTSGSIVPLTVCPRFDAASLFGPKPEEDCKPFGGVGSSRRVRVEEKVCTKRLVFEGSKIEALKALVSEKVENPSRVQVVTALIYKAALSTRKTVKGNLWRQAPSSLRKLINLRSRLEPPLPETVTGNILSFFIASSITTPNQTEMELWSYVADMKRNLEEFCLKFPKDYRAKQWASLEKLHMKECLEKCKNPGDYIAYTCSSWCNFQLYDADFGCGKPMWIGVPDFVFKNFILLMDAKDGKGVEATVSLVKEEMTVFEQNQELLSFCNLKTF